MRGAQVYKRVFHESASPVQILDELYTRLLRDLDEGRAFIAARDLGEKGRVLSHALAIVDELEAALRPDLAPDICRDLARLYQFTRDRIIAANLRIDASFLDAATSTITTLRDAFRQVGR